MSSAQTQVPPGGVLRRARPPRWGAHPPDARPADWLVTQFGHDITSQGGEDGVLARIFGLSLPENSLGRKPRKHAAQHAKAPAAPPLDGCSDVAQADSAAKATSNPARGIDAGTQNEPVPNASPAIGGGAGPPGVLTAEAAATQRDPLDPATHVDKPAAPSSVPLSSQATVAGANADISNAEASTRRQSGETGAGGANAGQVTSAEGAEIGDPALPPLVPPANRWCCEFGAWDGKHLSNTHTLLSAHGWAGLLIEAEPARVAELRCTHAAHPAVECVEGLVTLDGEGSIDARLRAAKAPVDLDLLCIDIDGADYWVWEGLREHRPRVVVIEFNPTIPHHIEFVQPRDVSVQQGSSLAALTALGRAKGYELVAATTFNAIFVPAELFPAFGMAPGQNTPHALHNFSMGTDFFQLYDGTLRVAGVSKLLWHRLPIDEARLQVLPLDARRFPCRPGAPTSAQSKPKARGRNGADGGIAAADTGPADVADLLTRAARAESAAEAVALLRVARRAGRADRAAAGQAAKGTRETLLDRAAAALAPPTNLDTVASDSAPNSIKKPRSRMARKRARNNKGNPGEGSASNSVKPSAEQLVLAVALLERALHTDPGAVGPPDAEVHGRLAECCAALAALPRGTAATDAAGIPVTPSDWADRHRYHKRTAAASLPPTSQPHSPPGPAAATSTSSKTGSDSAGTGAPLPLAKLPVIDLTQVSDSSALAAVRETAQRAAATTGFFALASGSRASGGGIMPEESVLQEAAAAAAGFFALPGNRKAACTAPRARVPRGYSGVGTEAFSILEGRRGPNDAVEKMRMGPPNADDPAERSPLLVPTPWGDGPEESACRLAMERLYRAFEPIAAAALELLDAPGTDGREERVAKRAGLGAESGGGTEPGAEEVAEGRGAVAAALPTLVRGHCSILSANSYPPAGGVRLAAHTDVSLVTIVWQGAQPPPSGAGGLEIWVPNEASVDGGEWRRVDSPWVVNVGDALAESSGGRWRSGRHRVSAPTPTPADDGGGSPEAPRLSFAFFANPRPGTRLDTGDTFEVWRGKHIQECLEASKR